MIINARAALLEFVGDGAANLVGRAHRHRRLVDDDGEAAVAEQAGLFADDAHVLAEEEADARALYRVLAEIGGTPTRATPATTNPAGADNSAARRQLVAQFLLKGDRGKDPLDLLREALF